ncbi:hypothetical protein PWT90_07189 [Aphanocladium album]|nr:hypothetical protein PWT90_07189 [Aphanocladium album]
MAVATVFALPELHETILIHLDMLTLLVAARRVNMAWRGLITPSLSLQQRLFLRPVPGDAGNVILPSDGELRSTNDTCLATEVAEWLPELAYNPLLAKYFSPCFSKCMMGGTFAKQICSCRYLGHKIQGENSQTTKRSGEPSLQTHPKELPLSIYGNDLFEKERAGDVCY